MGKATNIARAVLPIRASRKKTLYLHIGCHKTGTTAIQHSLLKNTQLLSRYGYSYYAPEGRGSANPYLGFNKSKGLAPDGMRVRFVQKLVFDLLNKPGTVIASSENLSFIFRRPEIERLKRHLERAFTDIKVICYLRRQDSHAVSHHQEGAKARRQAEYDLFGYGTSALPEWREELDLYLDYEKRLGMWGDVFGDENVILRVFDKTTLEGGSSVLDFFKLLGITEPPTQSQSTNVGMGKEKAKVGHIINQVVQRNELKRLLLGFAQPSEAMAPAASDAIAFYSHYRDSNRRLNDRFSFSRIPSIFPESDLAGDTPSNDQWDEASANTAIGHLVSGFSGVLESFDETALVESAVVLEKSSPTLGLQLLQLAAKLRPWDRDLEEMLEYYGDQNSDKHNYPEPGET